MKQEKKPNRVVLRNVDLNKPTTNRKLLVWVLVVTMGISLVFLVLGLRNKSSTVMDPLTMSFELEEPEIKREKDDSRQTQQLVAEIEEKLETTTGTYGVFVYRLADKKSYGINQEETMPGASILKIPAMIAVHQGVERGEVNLEDIYVLKEADKRSGSGPLEYMNAGTRLPISRVLMELGKKSDNTAWVALNKMMGMATMQRVMTDMGMTKSNYEDLETTALDVGKMWTSLYDGEIVSTEHRDLIWEYLRDSIYEDRIPKGLPEGLDVVHKVGTDADVWADSGIILGVKQVEETGSGSGIVARAEVEPLVIVILNKGVKRDEASVLVPEIVRMVWEYESTRER